MSKTSVVIVFLVLSTSCGVREDGSPPHPDEKDARMNIVFGLVTDRASGVSVSHGSAHDGSISLNVTIAPAQMGSGRMARIFSTFSNEMNNVIEVRGPTGARLFPKSVRDLNASGIYDYVLPKLADGPHTVSIGTTWTDPADGLSIDVIAEQKSCLSLPDPHNRVFYSNSLPRIRTIAYNGDTYLNILFSESMETASLTGAISITREADGTAVPFKIYDPGRDSTPGIGLTLSSKTSFPVRIRVAKTARAHLSGFLLDGQYTGTAGSGAFEQVIDLSQHNSHERCWHPSP
jgi:hypothetical protein